MQARARYALLAAAAVFTLFGFSRPASAVAIDWTPIGNAGNACETQSAGCFGAVGYDYWIGTYEVTNAQYAEFLNAKAAADPLALYSTNMGSGYGGIARSGVSGSFTYSAIVGRADMPVGSVTFYDALRFANWLNNGQGTGDTETGAYTLLGGTATPSNGSTVGRNAGATIVLPTENEWYKAAYYSALSTSYFDYPAGSNTQTTCSAPTATANRANCNFAVGNLLAPGRGDLTIRGSYTGSPSPYGTFDQGGNVSEWNEAIYSASSPPGRVERGGSFGSAAVGLAASIRHGTGPELDSSHLGFRVAMMIPEPSTGLLLTLGLLGLSRRRKPNA